LLLRWSVSFAEFLVSGCYCANVKASAIIYLEADFVLELIFDVNVNCEHVTDKPVSGGCTVYDAVCQSCDYD